MPPRNRRALNLALILAVLAALLGVSRAITHAQPGHVHAGKHAHAMTNVYFILNWLPNVEFAGLWVADQKGWFRQQGIQIGYKPWSQSVAPETDVPARGGNTFGFQSAAAIAIARSRNVGIKALYTDTQQSVFALTVLASSKIYKLTDLKGKRVGYQPHELYAPETMLSCVGLQAGKDYTTVPVNFDISYLTSGGVDAYLSFITNEPIALRLQGIQTRNFHAGDYCFHLYDDVMFTTDKLIQSNPTLVRKVTAIVARGFAWAHSHPLQATHITVPKYFPASEAGKGVTASKNFQQQLLELKAFRPFSLDKHGRFSGLMSAKYWQDGLNILFKYKQITHEPPVSSLFTNRFNPNK